MSKRIILLLFWLLAVVLVQATVVPQLGTLLRHIDLILATTAAVALLQGPRVGAAFGLTAGLFRDIALGFTLGFYALPLFVVGYGIGHLSRMVFHDTILVPFLAGLGSAFAQWLILTASNGFFYGYWLSGGYLWQLLFFILVNGLVVPVVYALFHSQQERSSVLSRGD